MSDDTAYRPRRSVLYMPEQQRARAGEGKTLPVDALILDLEDAVGPDHKEAARDNVCSAAASGDYGQREVTIRVNGLGTRGTRTTSRRPALPGPTASSCPRSTPPTRCEDLVAAMERHGAPEQTRLWAMVETPRSVLDVGAIATASAAARGARHRHQRPGQGARRPARAGAARPCSPRCRWRCSPPARRCRGPRRGLERRPRPRGLRGRVPAGSRPRVRRQDPHPPRPGRPVQRRVRPLGGGGRGGPRAWSRPGRPAAARGSSPTGDGWWRTSTSTSPVGSSRPTRPSGPAAEPAAAGAPAATAPRDGTTNRSRTARRVAPTDRCHVCVLGRQLCDRREYGALVSRRRMPGRHAAATMTAALVAGALLAGCDSVGTWTPAGGGTGPRPPAEPQHPPTWSPAVPPTVPGRRPPVRRRRWPSPVARLRPLRHPRAEPTATRRHANAAGHADPDHQTARHPHGEAADEPGPWGLRARGPAGCREAERARLLARDPGRVVRPSPSRPSTRSRRRPASGATGSSGRRRNEPSRGRIRPASTLGGETASRSCSAASSCSSCAAARCARSSTPRPATASRTRRPRASVPSPRHRGAASRSYRAVDGPVTNSLGELHRPRFFLRGYAVHGSPNIPRGRRPTAAPG